MLARHGIQCEACCDLRDASRTLGNDNEIHQHQDDEDHQPDNIVAAYDKVTERFDDVAGIAVQKNQARGSHIQREPEQGGHQQKRWKACEIDRILQVEDDQ